MDQDYEDLKRILGMDPLEVVIVKCGTFAQFKKNHGKEIRHINPASHQIRELLKAQDQVMVGVRVL